MVYFIKSNRSSAQPKSRSYEDRLRGSGGMIDRGALTDKDINFIVDSGDRGLKNELERKYQRELANSKHIQSIHGNQFDNKDNDGNLYKDRDLSDPIINPTTSKKDVRLMKNILKENL